MRNRVTRTKESNPKELLGEKEINDLFDRLNLSTAADREKFLRLERLGRDSNGAEQEPREAMRVVFGDSTASITPTR